MNKKMIAMATALLVVPIGGRAELYYNQEYNFSIDAPTGWAIRKSGQANTAIKFVYRDAEGHFAVLSIAAYDESQRVNREPLNPDAMYEQFKDEFRDFKSRRHSSGKIKIRSMDAVWNLFEIIDPPQARIIGKHYHVRRNGKLWRISAMTPSGRDFFDRVLPTMEQSISTLAFGL